MNESLLDEFKKNSFHFPKGKIVPAWIIKVITGNKRQAHNFKFGEESWVNSSSGTVIVYCKGPHFIRIDKAKNVRLRVFPYRIGNDLYVYNTVESVLTAYERKEPMKIFVFGSNLAGVHGAGAALTARKQYGAVLGIGVGMAGQSYAIPTKNEKLRVLTLGSIAQHVDDFIDYAKSRPEHIFLVTRIGCGLAGFIDKEIAPLFQDAPSNCAFDNAWKPWLGGDRTYWGSF